MAILAHFKNTHMAKMCHAISTYFKIKIKMWHAMLTHSKMKSALKPPTTCRQCFHSVTVPIP